MPLLNMYFYTPTSSDSIINHVVTRWDPPFAHCDVQFEDGMASSLYQGEQIYWRKRGFKKPGYSRITVAVNQAEYQKAYTLCSDRHAMAYSFDAINMYTMQLSSYFTMDRSRHTFCSKHCTEVLQVAGVKAVAGLDPRATTPSALQRALTMSGVFHTDRIDLRIEPVRKAAA